MFLTFSAWRVFCEWIELSSLKSWRVALTVGKRSLVVVKFQRKSLNESLEQEEVSNNRGDQSKLQCANSCFGFIILQLVFCTSKKMHPLLSGCFLRVWWTTILKKKLLNILLTVLGGYEKTTCHSKHLVKEAQIKTTLWERHCKNRYLQPVSLKSVNMVRAKSTFLLKLSC